MEFVDGVIIIFYAERSMLSFVQTKNITPAQNPMRNDQRHLLRPGIPAHQQNNPS